MSTILVLPLNRTEWARCASAMYAKGCNAAGHKLSAAATRKELALLDFDRVSAIYRAWLVFNEYPSA